MAKKTLEELKADQEVALAKNAERKRLLKETNEALERANERIAELEEGGADVTQLKEDLETATNLLEQLQEAVITDDDELSDGGETPPTDGTSPPSQPNVVNEGAPGSPS